jgi:signal transduction histidine kinase
VDDILPLAVALLFAAIVSVAALIFHQTVWKQHRRRRLERQHFRNKLR